MASNHITITQRITQRSVVWREKTYCESLRVYSSGAELCARTVAPLDFSRTSGSSPCFHWTFTPPRVSMSVKTVAERVGLDETAQRFRWPFDNLITIRTPWFVCFFFTLPFLPLWKCVSVEGMSTSWLFEL